MVGFNLGVVARRVSFFEGLVILFLARVCMGWTFVGAGGGSGEFMGGLFEGAGGGSDEFMGGLFEVVGEVFGGCGSTVVFREGELPAEDC